MVKAHEIIYGPFYASGIQQALAQLAEMRPDVQVDHWMVRRF